MGDHGVRKSTTTPRSILYSNTEERTPKVCDGRVFISFNLLFSNRYSEELIMVRFSAY